MSSMGRSHGGLITTIHALADPEGRLVRIVRFPVRPMTARGALLDDLARGGPLPNCAYDNDVIREQALNQCADHHFVQAEPQGRLRLQGRATTGVLSRQWGVQARSARLPLSFMG